MSGLVCWNCGENLDDIPRPISRHANCPRCFNELHCCRLCRHYDAQKTATCFEDRAEPPLQKENANFCDFYAPQFGAFQPNAADKSDSARADLQALFGGGSSEDRDQNPVPDAQSSQGPFDESKGALSKEEEARRRLDDLFN